MVSGETTNSSIGTTHGPIPSRPPATAARTAPFRLRPDRQVVVDRRRLPVQPEVLQPAALQQLEDGIEQPDQPHPPRLERHVPLPVPMGVGHDPHPDPCLRPGVSFEGGDRSDRLSPHQSSADRTGPRERLRRRFFPGLRFAEPEPCRSGLPPGFCVPIVRYPASASCRIGCVGRARARSWLV